MSERLSKLAVIYARISEVDAKVDKVERQTEQCRALAAREGYTVVAELSDERSASKGLARPDWDALISRTMAGEFDVILATEDERFTREGVADKEVLLRAALSGGAILHTVREGITDPENDDDEFMSGIRALVSRREVKRKAKRQQDAYAARLAEGKPLWGNRPFGFELDRLTIREDEAAMIREAYAHIEDGRTLYALIRAWNAAGVPTSRGNKWNYATARQLLLRASNAGRLVSKGAVIRDDLPRIVEPEQFDRVRDILTAPNRGASRGPRIAMHLMAGLATCGCGAPMRSGASRSRERRLEIYRCGAAALGQDSDRPHAIITRSILDEMIPGAVFEALVERARLGRLEGAEVAGVAVLRAERASLEQRRAAAQEVALMPGADLGAIRGELARIGARLDELNDAIADAHANAILGVRNLARSLVEAVEQVSANVLDAFTLTGEAYARLTPLWEELATEERRTLVKATLRVVINPDSISRRVKFDRNAEGLGSHLVVVQEGPERVSISFR